MIANFSSPLFLLRPQNSSWDTPGWQGGVQRFRDAPNSPRTVDVQQWQVDPKWILSAGGSEKEEQDHRNAQVDVSVGDHHSVRIQWSSWPDDCSESYRPWDLQDPCATKSWPPWFGHWWFLVNRIMICDLMLFGFYSIFFLSPNTEVKRNHLIDLAGWSRDLYRSMLSQHQNGLLNEILIILYYYILFT